MNKVFEENQKFAGWMYWLFAIPFALFVLFAIDKQLIKGEPLGNEPLSDTGLIILLIFIVALKALFYFIMIKVKIDQSEIHFQFFPFVNKRIKWEDVKKAGVVKYDFVGGWGIRLFTKYGTVYNVKGNEGLAVELKSGKKLLIGTQKREELSAFLEKNFSKLRSMTD